MQIKQALDWGAQALQGAGRPAPRLDSQVLLASALGVSKERLYTEAGREVPSDRFFAFQHMVARRCSGEPVQYVTGVREFMSLDFRVRPGVLIPRPETELLVEVALLLLRERAPGRLAVADIGTGSGAIAVSLASYARRFAQVRVIATDISPEALETARENAARNAVTDCVEFLAGDLMQPLRRQGLIGALDGIVSNPPYIRTLDMAALPDEVREYEPVQALDGGPDGLDFYRRLAGEASSYLAPDGFLAVEVGAGQAQEVLSMLVTNGFVRCATRYDLAGIDRVVWGMRGSSGGF